MTALPRTPCPACGRSVPVRVNGALREHNDPATAKECRNSGVVPQRRCRVCGCTDDVCCPGGCSWIEEDLCSACRGKEAA